MWIEGSLVSVTVETHPRYCNVSLSETLFLITIGYLTEKAQMVNFEKDKDQHMRLCA